MNLLLVFTLLLSSAPQDAGTLYFFRLEEVSRFQGNKPKVYIDDKLSFMLPESEFVGVRLTPGKYVVRMSGKRTETLLNVEAGKAYYVRVSRIGDGWSGMRDSLTVTDAEQALFQMRDMRPLEEKNVKRKDLETVRTKP